MSDRPTMEAEGAGSNAGWSAGAFAWLQGHHRVVLRGAAAFQVLVLAAMIVLKTAVLLSGDVFLLRVQPVDPRDLFRGDYVILGYAFSLVQPEQVVGLSVPTGGLAGTTIYAVLEPEADGVHWHAVRFSAEPPQGVKFLKGRYTTWNRVEYGIESFFVQEGRGRAYENAVRDRRLAAKVAVNGKGQAVLKELVIE